MPKSLIFAIYGYFISLAPATSEAVASRTASSIVRSSPPIKQDFGLESISDELPIAEPQEPRFMNRQVRFRAPKPAQLPRGPEIPQANRKPVKFPIPRANMGPELPKMPVAKKEAEIDKTPKAPARPVKVDTHKKSPRKDDDYPQPALRQRAVPNDKELKLKVIGLMEQVLYHTQDGNMLEVEEMAKKYQSTKQYRMAFIILKMDEVINEMHSVYSYLHKQLDTYLNNGGRRISMEKQLFYYAHMLQKNIDVTYAIEYLIEHFSEM